MTHFRPRQRGFTLVELLVTLLIMVIMVAIAIPAMQGTTGGGAVRSKIKDLRSTLADARVTAADSSANLPVVVCVTTDGATCGTAADPWEGGWISFVDEDGDGSLDADNEEILVIHPPAAAGDDLVIRTNPAVAAITFRGDGTVAAAVDIWVCASADDSAYRQALRVQLTGIVRYWRDSDGNLADLECAAP